jgi:hypothetical protein
LDKTGEPAEEDPDHGSEYDAGEVGCLVDAVRVGVVVEKDAGYDLYTKSEMSGNQWMIVEFTWCMPKNSASARRRPVYHGKIDKVKNMR